MAPPAGQARDARPASLRPSQSVGSTGTPADAVGGTASTPVLGEVLPAGRAPSLLLGRRSALRRAAPPCRSGEGSAAARSPIIHHNRPLFRIYTDTNKGTTAVQGRTRPIYNIPYLSSGLPASSRDHAPSEDRQG